MKKVYGIAALGAIMVLGPVSKVRADDGKPAVDWEKKGQEMEQKRLEMMTKKLKLTSDQQTKIKALLDDQHAQMKADGEKRRALREETDKKIKDLLTDEQKTEYTKMEEHRHKRMKERMEKRKARMDHMDETK